MTESRPGTRQSEVARQAMPEHARRLEPRDGVAEEGETAEEAEGRRTTEKMDGAAPPMRTAHVDGKVRARLVDRRTKPEIGGRRPSQAWTSG